MQKDTLKEIIEETVKESLKKILNENTEYSIDDELFEYAKLLPSQTGLRTVIYVDDGGAYIRNQHPLVVLFRNGYSETAEIMAIQVSKDPVLLSSSGSLKISTRDYNDILSFVSLNADLLQKFADEKVDHTSFYNTIKKCISNTQSHSMIAEMATLRKEVSHLPTTLWIDEGTKPQHGPRVKFKASNE